MSTIAHHLLLFVVVFSLFGFVSVRVDEPTKVFIKYLSENHDAPYCIISWATSCGSHVGNTLGQDSVFPVKHF